jgi:pimeloyl-ACP methyl ester carboxylesterase
VARGSQSRNAERRASGAGAQEEDPDVGSLSIDGTVVHFTDEGTGEPVVCLHSSAGSSHQWRALAARLRDRYRVLAPDLHGYGRTSAWTRPRPLGLHDEAALVAALARWCGAPVHVVGHSYGGAVALRLAHADWRLVRSLTLIEPVAFALLRPDRDAEPFNEVHAIKESCVAAVAAGRPQAAAERFVDYWSGPRAWAALPAHLRAAVTAAMPKVALEWNAVFADPTPVAEYARIAAPTLVLAGDRGPVPARRVAARLAGALPVCAYAVIPGAGHMAPITHAAAVNTAIEAHLDRHRAADAPWDDAPREAALVPA